jgi:hypothetical protein
MHHLQVGLLAATLSFAAVGSAAAQHQVSFGEWAAPWRVHTTGHPAGAALPDSSRRKAGYQHWKGAAIGTAAGAVLGTVLAFGVAGECDDCTLTTWDRAQAALLVTAAGTVFGFLVGLASPKYVRDAPLEPHGAE